VQTHTFRVPARARGRVVLGQVRADASADESVRDAGEANPLDNFAYVFDPKLKKLVMNRMDRNSDQVVKFLEIRSYVVSSLGLSGIRL
jgi:hypothetical protein